MKVLGKPFCFLLGQTLVSQSHYVWLVSLWKRLSQSSGTWNRGTEVLGVNRRATRLRFPLLGWIFKSFVELEQRQSLSTNAVNSIFQAVA